MNKQVQNWMTLNGFELVNNGGGHEAIAKISIASRLIITCTDDPSAPDSIYEPVLLEIWDDSNSKDEPWFSIEYKEGLCKAGNNPVEPLKPLTQGQKEAVISKVVYLARRRFTTDQLCDLDSDRNFDLSDLCDDNMHMCDAWKLAIGREHCLRNQTDIDSWNDIHDIMSGMDIKYLPPNMSTEALWDQLEATKEAIIGTNIQISEVPADDPLDILQSLRDLRAKLFTKSNTLEWVLGCE